MRYIHLIVNQKIEEKNILFNLVFSVKMFLSIILKVDFFSLGPIVYVILYRFNH